MTRKEHSQVRTEPQRSCRIPICHANPESFLHRWKRNSGKCFIAATALPTSKPAFILRSPFTNIPNGMDVWERTQIKAFRYRHRVQNKRE